MQPTREVFGNIAPWMQWAFYFLMLASIAYLVFSVRRRARLWEKGEPGEARPSWGVMARRLLVYALGQKRVHRRSLGGVLHLLIFSGFVVLTIGTTLLAISHAGPIDFHHGWYYLIYELTMDVFGVALCVGCFLGIYRRALQRPAQLGHQKSDWLVLALLLALGVTGFFLEGLRIRYTGVIADHGRWSTVSWAIAQTALFPLDIDVARFLHVGAWWLHAILVSAFFVAIPHTKLMHMIAGPANIAVRSERHAGALLPLSMEQVEESGRIGVGAIEQFSRAQLLSLDACMECGRCEAACPATASGKPLSPKALVIDLRNLMADGTPGTELHGDTIAPETLWACTMCQACVFECPVLIGHVDLIAEMRRHLVGEGRISGPPAVALRSMERQSNPYGRPASERLDWASGLDVPTVETNPEFEYLLWVGCAGAFDPRAQKATRATAQLLQKANVNFAVLGQAENCTGDFARRLGDEFLFQQQAAANIETFKAHNVRKVVTSCPHCLNTLANEYPQFGLDIEVQHHTQLLAELVRDGKLSVRSASLDAPPLTLHDPCYLARVNNETEAPRALIGGAIREMERSGSKTSCCGAGGGRMWFEEPPEQRVSRLRIADAAATGAKEVATACPFCLNMLSDAASSTENPLKVLDVAEILLRGAERES